MQKDRRILVTGLMQPGNMFLARLNPDGAPDPDFGSDGVVTGVPREGRCILPQQDGRIVVVGSAEATGFVSRFTGSGLPDPTFAPSGTVTVAADGGEAGLTRGALQKDGRLVVAGTSVTAGGGGVLVQRYRR